MVNQRLENRVRQLETQVRELTDKTNKREKKYEGCVIYFKKRDECHKAFSYLQEKGVDFQPIGSGTILTNQRIVEILKEGKFKFGVAKNTKELYEKEPNLIKYYAKQIDKHYNFS